MESVFEAIEYHNEMVDKMQDLAETLMKVYPDVESTEVNDAFCNAFGGLGTMAILLCCEANAIEESCQWMTTGDWHVVCADNFEE